MIHVVLVSEGIGGRDAASRRARQRADALGARFDDLVVIPTDTRSVEPLGDRAARSLSGPTSTVVVVDGNIELLARTAPTVRAVGARVLWSVDAAPSVEASTRAATLADGALVASPEWLPRRLGIRTWVVRDRTQLRGRDAQSETPALDPVWPPSPDDWADRVVQAAQTLIPAQAAPESVIGAGFGSVGAMRRVPPWLAALAGDSASRNALLLGVGAVAAVVVGLVIAAGAGFVHPDGGGGPPDPRVGIDTRTDGPSPGADTTTATGGGGGSQTTGTTGPGRTQSAGTATRSAGTGSGANANSNGSRTVGSAVSPTTAPKSPGTEPPVTSPPATTPPTTSPPTTSPPTTSPPVTLPPVTLPPVTLPPVTLPPATTPTTKKPPTTVLPPIISLPRIPILPIPLFP